MAVDCCVCRFVRFLFYVSVRVHERSTRVCLEKKYSKRVSVWILCIGLETTQARQGTFHDNDDGCAGFCN